jgi:hypothetical protein
MMAIAISLILVSIYLLAGLLFAIAFVIKGVEKIDQAAHGSSFGFRVIIIPGAMIFWPWLLKKWVRSSKSVHHD